MTDYYVIMVARQIFLMHRETASDFFGRLKSYADHTPAIGVEQNSHLPPMM
jgi:hypothetical protein